MLTKLLFWIFLAADLGALGLVLVLGLAAAGPSRTSPLAFLALLSLPIVVLAAAALLHLRSRTPGLQLLAFVLVSAPITALAITRLVAEFQASANPGGIYGETPLTKALRTLPQQPNQIDTVRTLLAGGADPNQDGEVLPLVLAVRAAQTCGPEALTMLLDAGAEPNRVDAFGRPAWFCATGITVDLTVLQLLLERGADVASLSTDGRSGAWAAVNTRNWPAALLLVQRGAPLSGRSPMGRSLLETLESQLAHEGSTAGLQPVLDAVRARR